MINYEISMLEMQLESLKFWLGILIVVLIIIVLVIKVLWNEILELEKQVALKKDDDSPFITDEEWEELQKEYGVILSVNPFIKLTRNNAIRLLQNIKESEEKHLK